MSIPSMSNHSAALPPALPRAAALSLYAGQEGQINLHKLLEAAIYAAVRLSAARQRANITWDTLEPVLADLQALEVPPLLLDALALAQATIKAGDVPLIESAPDAFVCRVCGHTALAAPPERCPTCGAWPATFRRFAGIFNVDNPDPLSSLELLAHGPAVIAALLDGLAESILTIEPVPGNWSLQRALQHLLDAQNLLASRLDRMLAQDDPLLAMESTWARPPAVQNTQAMLEEFRQGRAHTVAQLESLPLRAWGRTGRHTEFGRVTILQQVGYFAYHEAFHYTDFVEKRRQLGIKE